MKAGTKASYNYLTDPCVNKTNNFMTKTDLLMKDSSSNHKNTNLKPKKSYQSDPRENNDPKLTNDYKEIPRKQSFDVKRISTDNEKRNTICFNKSKELNLNNSNCLMMNKNSSPNKDISSSTTLKPNMYNQYNQKLTTSSKQANQLIEIPRKEDFIEVKYSVDSVKQNIAYFNDLKQPNVNKISSSNMKNDIQRKDSSTQYSNTNLKPGEYVDKKIMTEVISPQHTRTCSLYKEKSINLSCLPSYYSELIPKVSRSRTTNLLPNLHIKENSSWFRPKIIQDGCKYSRSQHFSSEHQMRHEVFFDINCVRKNKFDHGGNRTYFINHLEAKPFKIGQMYQTGSKNWYKQNKSKLKNKKHNAECKMFCGMKSESEAFIKYKYCDKVSQAMKNKGSYTSLYGQALMCNYNFLNAQKAHPFNAQNDNVRNILQQRNKRHIPLDMLFEIKSEPQPVINRCLARVEENQATKYHQNSNTDSQKQTSTSCNSFQNVLKECPVQNRKSHQKRKAYYESMNYTQYLIQKLSEKSSKKNIGKEEQKNSQLKLCDSSSSFEEKCTQTLIAVPSKKAKTLIYKEKVTQTIV